MEQFFINLYDFYLEIFSIGTNRNISFFQRIYYVLHQGLLYYLGFYQTIRLFIGNFPEAGIFIDLINFRYNIKLEYVIFLPFIVLFLLNILTYFVGRFFGRNIEKKHSNKLNYYIIFFHFFPIVGFLGNFIVGKKFKISFLNLLLKNFLLLVVIFFYWAFSLYISNIIGDSMIHIYSVLFLIFPILIGICSYFYYFKFKKN